MSRLGQLVCVGVAIIAATVPVRADEEDTIDYRTHIMNTMGEQVATLSQILQQKIPGDSLQITAQALSITATTVRKAFEPNAPGGESKPNVWTQWPDFSKRLDELVAVTADLAVSTRGNNVASVASKIQAGLTCKSCHDVYRIDKK